MTDTGHRPTVAVVIPCFNQARFLPAAVSSVRAQRHPCAQCIVVNDGSTDDTAAVARGLNVDVIEQPNRGVSHARNAGLAAARTDYVVFVDADDELLPDALLRGVEALQEHRSAAAVVGRCQLMDVTGGWLPAVHNRFDPSDLYTPWLSTNFVWTLGAAMFRRRMLDDIGGFPPSVGPASDYAVYLRLARNGCVRFIAEELARYRQHDESMSRNSSMMLRATLAVLRQERVEAPAARGRIRLGRRDWCAWYGDQIVERLRTDWRAGRRGRSQLEAAAVLVRYCPAVALRHLARKARLVLAATAHSAVGPLVRLVSAGGRSIAP